MSSFLSAGALARIRLQRPSLLVLLALTTVFVALFALLDETQEPAFASRDTLLYAVLGVSIPISAFGLLEISMRETRMDLSVGALARYGAHRRYSVFGFLGAQFLLLSGVALFQSLLGICLSSGFEASLFGEQLLKGAGLSLLAALSYLLWFACGSTLGRRGGGRAWALGLDLILGSSDGVAAALWPRAHLRNLAGSAPVGELSQAQSVGALLALCAIYLLIVAWRTPP